MVTCLISGTSENKTFTIGSSFIITNKTDVSVMVETIYFTLIRLLEEYEIDLDLNEVIIIISYRRWIASDDFKVILKWSKLMDNLKGRGKGKNNEIVIYNKDYQNISNVQDTPKEIVSVAGNDSQPINIPNIFS